MNRWWDYLASHWLVLVFLALAIASAVLALPKRRSGWSRSWLLAAAAFFLVGLGGWPFSPEKVLLGLTIGSLAVLGILLFFLLLTGFWRSLLGYLTAALLLVGLGGLAAEPGSALGSELCRFLLSLEPFEPWWLLLLLLIPVIIRLSFRSLAGLGPVRRWLAIALRCSLVLLLTLALAETQARRSENNLTVLFLWDRSLSIPQEWEESIDRREERLFRFINEAVARRGPGREGDRTGVIVFGRQPRLELPPASVKQLNFRKVQSLVDDTYTDIAAAIKLALASFPEGTGKRIVLISDGNENLGKALEQARLARQNGVQIDVVPLAAGRRSPNEVLVERIEAPAVTEKDARVPIRIVIRSFHPGIVVGNLQLIKISLDMKKVGAEEAERPVFEAQPVLQQQVELRYGLNVFFFQQPGARKEESCTYEAKFVPLHIKGQQGRQGLPGDRVENNRASTVVVARGQRAVLLIEPNVGDHKLLVDRLQRTRSSLKVVAIEPARLPQDPAQLALVLSKFDCVILANLPAESLTSEQQTILRSNTHDQGCGLIMIGGPQSYGAGGWQGTEVEKALPVTCDLKSTKVEGKGGLVLMMHASEMAQGNMWQKKVAKLAIDKLSLMDMVGMLYYDWLGGPGGGGHKWHIPFQLIGQRRATILGLVDKMEPGDMPDVDPAFEKAHDELTKAEYGLSTKHIIFISDGDHWDASRAVLTKLKNAKISCTTVCITTHGAAEVKKMAAVAAFIGGGPGKPGRSYHVKDGSELPAIYIKESRLVSQSFVHEKSFQPILQQARGPTEGLSKDKGLQLLHGFVRTTRRPSPLVEVLIDTPKLGDSEFPILALWHYGLGKAAAFTSDARTHPGGPPFWDRDWANSDMYAKFWEQTVDWSLRATETGRHLFLNTEQGDGKVRVIIEARDAQGQPLTEVELKGGLTTPKVGAGRPPELKFEQKNSGVYEAEFKAEDVGAYFLNIHARWKDKDGKDNSDSVRTGVAIPYSPEFAEMESNTALLERLRDLTGGQTYAEDEASLAQASQSGELFRPVPRSHHSLQSIWAWLAVLTAVLLFFDVAVRRIAVEPHKVAAKAQSLWDQLRGQAPRGEQVPQFLERLQSRKAQAAEGIGKEQAARRFEGAAPAAPAVPLESPPPPPPSQRPPVAPEKEKEPEDYASRLLRAKKRALEERDKRG